MISHVDWLPESIFEQAYTLYDEALPGRGSIAERLHHWQESFMLPPEKAYLLPSFFQRALTEALLRTQTLVPLPADTQTEIQTIMDRPCTGHGLVPGEPSLARLSQSRGALFLSPISSMCYVMRDIRAILPS